MTPASSPAKTPVILPAKFHTEPVQRKYYDTTIHVTGADPGL